ncbi:MAG TPA: hypothetical protein VHR36_02600 [Pyrinomonadaceae bacterium]|jgi:hypothetical protein|nr:hypothetical protein [Pyrinomonadaceae bacterium]
MKSLVLLFLTVFTFNSMVLAQSPGPQAAAIETIQPSRLGGPQLTAPVKPSPLQIPDGTPIEVEAPYTVSSMDFKPEDKISFRVVDAVKVAGVTVIEQGATATGVVEKSKRGGHWGKAGLFVWSMQSVTAADGSQVPVRATSVRLRGDSKGAKVATAMVITGALMPLIAPVALLHGFKRGENAYIPAGKRYTLFVDSGAAAVRETTSANTPK